MNRSVVSVLISFLFVLAIASCNTKTENPEPEDTDFYVSYTLDGAEVRLQNGVDGYGNGPGRISYLDGFGPLNSQFTLFSTDIEDPDFGRNTFKIQRAELKPDSIVPTYAEAYQLFSEGTYDFGSILEDSISGGIAGVVIEYVDADSTVWTSDAKIGAQEGWATFEITSHEESGNELFGAKTSGTFNCRLFNSGNFIDLTNGTFRARTIYEEQ